MPRLPLALAAALAVGVPVLGACAGGSSASPAETHLEIRTFSFTPNPLMVPPDSVVVVANADPTTHTVTAGAPDAPTGGFDVELVGKGATAELGSLPPGTYPFFCRIHPSMTGRLVVG